MALTVTVIIEGGLVREVIDHSGDLVPYDVVDLDLEDQEPWYLLQVAEDLEGLFSLPNIPATFVEAYQSEVDKLREWGEIKS